MTARCTGHCCKRFYLPYTFAEIAENYRAFVSGEAVDKNGHAIVRDIQEIALMVVPIEPPTLQELVALGLTEGEAVRSRQTARYYTCRHLQPNGDCGIYERRPRMCSEYPYGGVCKRPGCTLDPNPPAPTVAPAVKACEDQLYRRYRPAAPTPEWAPFHEDDYLVLKHKR